MLPIKKKTYNVWQHHNLTSSWKDISSAKAKILDYGYHETLETTKPTTNIK